VLDKDRHNTSERWRDHVIVHGDVAAGFEEVQQAFVANFDQHGDVGAAFTLFVGGTKAVDIWGGVADVKTDRARRESPPSSPTFSPRAESWISTRRL
jgi:hypothetical protein